MEDLKIFKITFAFETAKGLSYVGFCGVILDQHGALEVSGQC